MMLTYLGPLMAAPLEGAWQGRTLADLLDELRTSGLPIVYSTNLVGPSLKVLQEPTQSDPLELLTEVLRPHGLEVQELEGMYLVVRANDAAVPAAGTASLMVIVLTAGKESAPDSVVISSRPPLPDEEILAGGIHQFRAAPAGVFEIAVAAAGFRSVQQQVALEPGQTRVLKVELELGPAELENLSVSASRYVLFSNSQFFIDQRAIQALPDLGEDPIRSAHRLPGAAASGLSSSSHFRGGEQNETAIYLNGLQLMEPFHVRNYNDIFSTIDSRAITGVEAYTGGFPADYGDSMSGVLLLQSQRPETPRHVELGVSVYNTSALFSGYNADETVDWLFSARRSNLDIFLDDDLGKPDYFDIFTELGVSLTANTRLSFNALFAKDQVVVITEPQLDELEESTSDSRNWHFWILLESQWSTDLSSSTVVSSSHLRSLSDEQVNDPDQYSGTARDQRKADVLGLRQEWQYQGVPDHVLRFGFEVKHHKARFDYRSQAVYDDFFVHFPGIQNPATTEVQATPSGNSYSLFVSDRWRLARSTALQLGLRRDRQTYTDPTYSNQLSPRISLLRELNSSIDLRISWGRYYQSQAIQQLQVEDGIDHFFPAQRADHWIAGLQYRSAGDYRLRLEIFDKKYGRLKPRFENLFDKLALIPELEPDRVRLDPDSARARGIEMGVEYRGERELNWWLNTSLSKSTDSINGRNERRAWDQRFALQGGIAWTRGPWEVGAALNLHSGWPTTGMSLGIETGGDADVDEGEGGDGDPDADEIEYIPIPGPRNGERVGRFVSLDFRVSRVFRFKKSELTAFFEVTNVTDRHNVCCLDYDLDEDEQGNSFLDRTNDFWLPVIPAAGILWEF